jgi:formylglycine-generating enzyme required for sulfatase activity
VIGNGAYAEAPIPTAVEGCRGISEVLTQGGFKVVGLWDARRDDILRAVQTFSQLLERGGTGIIYYAGHAVQYEGRNYLVAVDSKISGPEDLRSEGIDLDLLFDPLIVARSPASVIILDASRANPWQQRVPGNLRGLATPELVKGITVISAAAPGRLAGGSPQTESVFATQLAQAMGTPGLGLDAVINRTKSAVGRVVRDQSIWQSSPVSSELIITPVEAVRPQQDTVRAQPADAVEVGFWDTIKNSPSAADFQAYLSAYPQGQFAAIARAKLAQLQPKAAESAPNREAGGAAPAQGQAPSQQAPAGNQAAAQATSQAAPASSPVLRECPTCPEMVLIPAGGFTMGAADVFPFEAPVHNVTIAKPFYVGRREVTFDEWDACIKEGGCQYRPGDRGQGRGLNPVTDLDWNDANTYIAWLSKKTGQVYRLPTEAEWEYAARAGSKTRYYWGNAIEKDRANCNGCNTNLINKMTETGSFPPNAFGLLDMAGNAAEWVQDCWAENYKSAPEDGSAYTPPGCHERVLRGGSFNNDARFVRTAARFKYDFDVRYYANGFRIVRER